MITRFFPTHLTATSNTWILKEQASDSKISKELIKDHYDVHFLEEEPGVIYVSYWPSTNVE